MATPSVKHVIVDSGPFIANAAIKEVGEHLHTIRDVISEIRDKATRQRLQVLPYDLNFREPSTEAIHAVTEFAKKTGDYRSLSAVDLRLIALTYQLTKEHCGTENIKATPQRDVQFQVSQQSIENPTAIAGIYYGKQSETNKLENGQVLSTNLLEVEEKGSGDESSDDDEEDSDDGEGWVTPENIEEIKRSWQAGDPNLQKADITVGCMTGDFAMQNVLIQMGLNVVSYNGMLIKQAKSYVLRCHACFKITTNMSKMFCPHCGNQTLQKVSCTVDEDGKVRYFLNSRKQFSKRGLKYSLPTPRGGKHANNPILCEDQKEAQQKAAKSSNKKYNAMDPDYIAYDSPFAPIDITSRSAQLGIRGDKQGHSQKRRNPNEVQGKGKGKGKGRRQ